AGPVQASPAARALAAAAHHPSVAVKLDLSTRHRFDGAERQPMFNRLKRDLQQALDPNKTGPQPRQPTVDSLLPGDVVSMGDLGDHVVESVLDCREELNQRVTSWRWNLLDEGHML